MRISSNYLAQNFIATLDQQQTALAATQQQISTGLKFTQASQDPAAATQSLDIQSTVSQLSQYSTNSNLAQSRLSIEDSSLSAVTNLLQSVRTLAVEAANATQTPETRASIAANIQQQIHGLLSLANTQDGTGQYIFAGTATGSRTGTRRPSPAASIRPATCSGRRGLPSTVRTRTKRWNCCSRRCIA